MYKEAILKEGRERSLLNRHPWIFSGAVKSLPDFEDGELLAVKSTKGELLGHGYFNRRSSLVGRMISFGAEAPLPALSRKIREAIRFRQQLFARADTSAYRLINGEGDGIPGLVVDRYHDVIVIQSGTLGIDKLMPIIVQEITQILAPVCVYERSLLPTRKEEGVDERAGVLSGKLPEELLIRENGMQFRVSVTDGQKTGFFLDQREMRQLVRELSSGRKVLNCFSFTGAFSVAALVGGATEVTSVDISKSAVAEAEHAALLNDVSAAHRAVCEDVFKFLRSTEERYDLIILDPPAFAKKRAHVSQAAKGYNDINRVAMQRLSPGGILVTCSCSHFVEPELFRKIVFSAARDAGRAGRIIQEHRLAMDHPVSVFHPEGAYLKSVVAQFE